MSEATHGETPNCGTASKDNISAKSDGLEDISAAAHTSVKTNIDATLTHRANLPQNVERSRYTIELATSVVGNNNTVQSIVDGKLGILYRVD